MSTISASIDYRVPYADTDQMTFVYYANYLIYFEMSREELMRAIGLPYSRLEELGCALPVLEAVCHYKKPAKFEDVLTITASLAEMKGVRVKIACTVKRGDELLAEGWTVHAFMNRDGRPQKPPQVFLDAISSAPTTTES
jgi:acyl-CoA thioester hydrolase